MIKTSIIDFLLIGADALQVQKDSSLKNIMIRSN